MKESWEETKKINETDFQNYRFDRNLEESLRESQEKKHKENTGNIPKGMSEEVAEEIPRRIFKEFPGGVADGIVGAEVF